MAVEEVTHLWREHPDRTSRNSEHYQQIAFFNLKTDWFVRNELSENESVQLIGTGVKSDLVAKKLREYGVVFEVFDVRKRPGIRSVKVLDPTCKTILTSWPIDEQTRSDISSFLAERGFEFGRNVWLF